MHGSQARWHDLPRPWLWAEAPVRASACGGRPPAWWTGFRRERRPKGSAQASPGLPEQTPFCKAGCRQASRNERLCVTTIVKYNDSCVPLIDQVLVLITVWSYLIILFMIRRH